MIRRLIRLFGFLLIAAGFVVAIIDGARWIGTNVFSPMPLATVAQEILGGRYAALERSVAPLVWNWLLQPFFTLPAFAVISATGFLLLWLARPPAPMVGFAPRP